MDTYYKYSKYFGIESLQEPVIRLSAPAILNDPFEKLFNEEVEKNLISRLGNDYFRYPFINSLDDESKAEFIKYQVNESVNQFGIVSLSETHSNLLMWSHYADEHKGICIGFNKNFLSQLPRKIFDEYQITNYTPIKVNYNNKRPQYFIDDNDKANEIRVNTLRQLTTKGDNWIYEKEHRCIVPLMWADELKILDHNKLRDVHKGILQVFNNDFKVIKGNRYIFKKDKGDRKGACIAFSDTANAVLLKKLNPKAIKSIHMGCKMDFQEKLTLIKTLNNSKHPLYHVDIYDYVESKERYELVEKRIKP